MQYQGIKRNKKSSQAILTYIALPLLVFGILYFAFIWPQASPDKAHELSAKGELTYQSAGCEIKGSSAKEYFLPGQNGYDGVNMASIINARWFCSEQDATRNGWIKAKP